MLVAEGEARNDVLDTQLGCLLAAVAGALNAAAFYSLGYFAANMTGNVSLISNEVALGQWAAAMFYLGVVLAFTTGAGGSAAFITVGLRRGIRAIYAYAILGEAALLVALFGLMWMLPSSVRSVLFVIGLAFAMGAQNAVVTRISGARVRTTHISGMATDLGIEMAMGLVGKQDGRGAPQYRAMRLHALTISSFLAGGVAGVLIYRAWGNMLLLGTACALAVMAVRSLARLGRVQLTL